MNERKELTAKIKNLKAKTARSRKRLLEEELRDGRLSEMTTDPEFYGGVEKNLKKEITQLEAELETTIKKRQNLN